MPVVNRTGNPGTAAQEQRDLNAANKNDMKTVWQKTSPVQPAAAIPEAPRGIPADDNILTPNTSQKRQQQNQGQSPGAGLDGNKGFFETETKNYTGFEAVVEIAKMASLATFSGLVSGSIVFSTAAAGASTAGLGGALEAAATAEVFRRATAGFATGCVNTTAAVVLMLHDGGFTIRKTTLNAPDGALDEFMNILWSIKEVGPIK